MSYKALYRAYRPRSFSDIAGQMHVTKTFQNALKNNRMTHAYLFSGPRGTGKTSIAKIIANTVNCANFPVSEPCGVCDNCLSIKKGMFNDVIEIDAASNNGVDEIREIRDKVKYTPSQGKYKVYIIDEVHMLSIGAFNALLKTLEEPPSHVIFILATTEPHKIPATIQSRCQRFDFKEISIKDIRKKLKEIIEKEEIKVTLEAIDAIAEAAEGGMRDALSLLDQAISYSEDGVKDSDVHAVAGTVSDFKIIKIFRDISDNNVVNALKIVEELIENGKEVHRINHQMILFLKDLLVFKNVSGDSFKKSIYGNQEFIDLSKKISNEMIFFYVECLSKSQNDMRFTNNPRTYLELTLIKMTDHIQQGESALFQRIEALEKRLENVTVQEKKEVLKQPVAQKVEAKEDPVEINLFDEPIRQVEVNVFDVELISSVLSEAMSNKAEAKAHKQKLQDSWGDINLKAEPHMFAIAKEFSIGEVVVAKDDYFIITFDHVVTVNKLMRQDVTKKIQKLFKEVYKKDYKFMALPKEVWLKKRKEYVDQFSVGITEPKLSPIDYPGLEVVEEKKEEPEIVKRAADLFGQDKINIR